MKKIFKFLIIFIILLIVFYLCLLGYAKMASKLPIKSANSYYMYDDKENLFSGKNEWTSLNNMSDYIIDATISIEDKNFYKHHGFDYFRIIKALSTNIKKKENSQGASTITQQYAKNLFLSFDKKWSRKAEEAILTLRLEAHYSKKEILEGYLNTINYGGIFGIENAANYYFGKKASELDLAEASILAGIPKSPSNYSPISNYKKAKERQKLILNSMVNNGYITKREMNDAYKEDLKFVGSLNENNSNLIKYFEDAVYKELKGISSIPDSLIETGGLKIYTTLDKNALNILENNIKKYVTNDLQVAAVIMNPNNGEIKAIAGGTDYSKSEFNRVTDSKRQVGSTIKPILYYAALENGFTASSVFTSEKTTFNLGSKTYSPKNYNDIYGNKNISMSAAIAYSDNIYAVKTHIFLGEQTLVDTANRLGITSKMSAIPSLALGTEEINILEMMKAYSTFANEGYSINPHFIKKVEDINGNTLYKYKEKKKSILNKSDVYILNELLTSSYDSNLVDYNTPTCLSIAAKMSKRYAVKTGTTDTDHLIFGYNKDAITGIWIGYDDNRDTSVNIGSNMKNLWIDTMEEYLKDKKDNWYKKPENVVGVLTNPISGELANENDTKTKILYYIKGTQPFSEHKEDSIPTIKEQ